VRHALLTAATLALLAGCGTSTAVSGEQPDSGTVPQQAERALDCDGEPAGGGAGDYADGGLEAVQDGPKEALEDWLDNEAWAYQLPEAGYRVEREDGDRVLLSYDVGGRTKIAFVAADGVRDWNDDDGWGIESWSRCDPAELPADVTDALGIGVWEDAAGHRAPTTRIRSFQGPEHCDWQDITFLHIGPQRDAEEYLRDTTGELADLLSTTYDGAATVPRNATDTGLRRDGRQLWLGPDHDAAYLVSLDDPGDVERWPAAKRPIGCA
jgi:hypothetical protein